MKHRLTYHLQLTLFGLLIGGSLLMLTTVKAQGINGVSQCRDEAPKINSSCTKDFESLKDQYADKPCLEKKMFYLCNAAYLCKKCNETEVSELTADLRKKTKEFIAGNGNCSSDKVLVDLDLDTVNCQRIMNFYFGGASIIITIIITIGIALLILICCCCCIGVLLNVLVHFIGCKGEFGKAKSKSNSSKRKTGKRGKSSTGQGKSSTGAGKSSTGQGKSSTGASGKSATGAPAEAK